MDGSALRKMFIDPRGCHVLEKFVSSTTVGEKSRESIARRLSGEFVALSCSKHGSYALEALWNSSSLKTKQMIVEELAKDENLLRSHRFGKFVYQSCAVSVWKHQRAEWNQAISMSAKERELFKDIIGEDVPAQKRKLA